MRRFGRHTATLAQVMGAAALALGSSVLAQPSSPLQNAAQNGAQSAAPNAAPNGTQSASPGRRGQFAGMERVAGEVASVNGNTLTVKAENGTTVQVVTTENTRLMKDRAPVKVTDLHPGDGLMAFGNLDEATHTLHAAIVMAEDAAQVKAMRENLGKTYITGRVTAIDLDNAKMTVERPDHQSQTIGFDESTSFKRAVRGERNNAPATGDQANAGARRSYGGGMGMGMMGDPTAALDRGFANGESITLADIKVGDFVAGTGAVKAGVFVPTHLLDSPPGQRRQRGAEAPGSAPPTPPAPPAPGGPGGQ